MKVDRRVIKTEKALEDALLYLMKSKPIEQITTTELCRTAGINRNTFYSHYPNPMNLLQRIEGEFIKITLEIIDNTVADGGYSLLLERVFDAIIEHKALSIVLLSRNGDPNYLKRIIESARVPVKEYWKSLGTTLSDDDLDVLFTFLSNGAKQVVLDWTQNNFDQPPKELAKTIGNLADVVLEYYLPKTTLKER